MYGEHRDVSLKCDETDGGARWGGTGGKCGREEKCMQRFGEETRRKYTAFNMGIRWEDNIKVYLEATC